MTDVFYPDRSQFQGQTPVSAHAIVARASEGDWLTDTAYAFNGRQAASQGAQFMGYHFLEDGSAAKAQAAHALSIAGKDVPLMLDFEPIIGSAAAALPTDDPGGAGQWCGSSWAALQNWRGHTTAQGVTVDSASVLASAPYISKPGMALAEAFIDAYRAAGGICHVVYFPHWYWQALGSPSLKPFTGRRMVLVSSNYTTYSDTGPGWAPYGGMTPMFWQYTDAGPGNQDWNAYRSKLAVKDAVAEIGRLWRTGSRAAPTPGRKVADGHTSLRTLAAAHGTGVPAALWETAQHEPGGFGRLQQDYVRAGNWDAPMPAGMVAWVP